MPLKLVQQGERVLVDVHVVPRAKKTAVVGVHDGRIKVALDAPPVDGAANEALVSFFAKALRLQKREVSLIRGDKSRQKTLALSGVTEDQVRALLPPDGEA